MTHSPRSNRLVTVGALLAVAIQCIAASAALASGDVRASGKNLIRDGQAWVPRGVVLIAFVAPETAYGGGKARDAALAGKLEAVGPARQHFGSGVLDAVRQIGADVIRFQVSQPGLDPNSPIYSAKYAADVAGAVHTARKAGFSVILSMQRSKRSGLRGQKKLPSDATIRAWQTLAPQFKSDQGVIFELFNEPGGVHDDTPETWEKWRSATQPVIDTVRSLGARNLLVVEGIRAGQILSNVPTLKDPESNLAYGVHPYFKPYNDSPDEWDAHFGRFAETHPVIATEWSAVSAWPSCRSDLPQTTQTFFQYLRKKRIGLIGWALDIPGTLIRDFSFKLTSLDQLTCGAGGHNGVGEELKTYFHSSAS